MRIEPLLAVALSTLFGGIALAKEAPPILAGVARVDITPDGPIRLSGYAARDSESKGGGRPIEAQALALGSDAEGASVLVAVDNLGIPEAMTEELAARLKRRAGIARERLAVASSHTHSAPCLPGVVPNIFGKPIPPDQQARLDRYARELIDKLEAVCLEALTSRGPCRLDWGQGRVDFAINRRTKGGPVDHALPVLRVAGRDGKPAAIVVGYACHCTTLDPKDNIVSGDWAAEARDAIESANPGSVALVLIGCGADSNPRDRPGQAVARRHGRAIADEVARLLKGPLRELSVPPSGRLARLKLPFDTLPTRDDLTALVAKGGTPGYNASTLLARLDRGEPLPTDLDYVAQSWTFGDDLAMVFMAGEVVVDYALRLKAELDPARLWTVAYANDDPCYIPSERILREGGYEAAGAMVYYGRPTRLKPGVEDRIVAAVHGLVPASFAAKPEEKEKPKAAATGKPASRTPAEGLASIRVRPGLRVELVAAEPLVVDPVAIDWGSDGKLWVCEMRDYPAGSDGDYKPGGRVRTLEDSDGDGRYDRATTFLDGLPFPTGVMAWRKGVLICAAPEILYAEDTDGDGRADVRKVLFRGFATENYQARVNGLAYGLDNWVYGANGLTVGKIRGEKTGRETILGNRDFRIRPDDGSFEPASGLTQQGRVRDDWGHQFGGSNSVWIQHYALPDRYARRNPHVASPDPAVYLPRDPDNRRVYPASETAERFNNPESANQVTSACSPLIHRDPYLGPGYLGNAFICEPVHNLVHREVLTADGVTFAGHRSDDERASEFFASTDPWCRPVQVRTGPDGAIYVVDMYRAVIEHPRWISPGRLANLDLRAGSDRGRIYRVVRDDQPPRAVPVLDRLATPALAEALDSPNGTLRDAIQRILVHRGDSSAAPVLARLGRSSRLPEARVQALATLDGLGLLDPEEIRVALGDPDLGVREQAVLLAEGRLATAPGLGAALLPLATDPEVRVRYQVALTLGEWDDPRAGQALGSMAIADATDPWVRAAVFSSAVRRSGDILPAVLDTDLDPARRSLVLGPLIATAAATATPEALARVLDACTVAPPSGGGFPTWRLAALAALLEAGERPGTRAEVRPEAGRLRPAFEAARALAQDDRADAADRVVAVRLLGRGGVATEADLDALADLIGPRHPAPVQSAALAALGRLHDDRAPARLLAGWSGLGPSLRGPALDALLARADWTSALLGALERGEVRVAEVDAARRQRLLALPDEASRGRAAKLLAAPRGRREVVEAYAKSRDLPGNPTRGASAFGRLCAGCHKVGALGHAVGPDLAALTDTSPEALAIAILDPNREVDGRYLNYAAATADGRVFTGLIASETGNAITLKRQDDQVDVVLRADLEELKDTGSSLMPEGLERDMTPADLADLVAYLGASNRPKDLAGNRPELVASGPDGSIRLEARSAAVYGDTLVFEPQFANLGEWRSGNDRAAWTFRVDRPGSYTLSMDYACDDGSAGEMYLLRVGPVAGRGMVGGTGSWSDYRPLFVREVRLPAGVHRLEIRPERTPRVALLDLRGITLTPR